MCGGGVAFQTSNCCPHLKTSRLLKGVEVSSHLISIEGLKALFVVVVGSGVQVFLVENDIFWWACLQNTCFLEKLRDKPEQVLSVRLQRGNSYGNKQSCEDIATAIVSWSVSSLHVCA